MLFKPCRTNKIMEYLFNQPSFNDELSHGVGCRHPAPNHFLSQCWILILRNSKELYYMKYVRFITLCLYLLFFCQFMGCVSHWFKKLLPVLAPSHFLNQYGILYLYHFEKWRFINISWTIRPQHHHITSRCGSQLIGASLWALSGIHNWRGFFLSRWAFFLAGEMQQQSWHKPTCVWCLRLPFDFNGFLLSVIASL